MQNNPLHCLNTAIKLEIPQSGPFLAIILESQIDDVIAGFEVFLFSRAFVLKLIWANRFVFVSNEQRCQGNCRNDCPSPWYEGNHWSNGRVYCKAWTWNGKEDLFIGPNKNPFCFHWGQQPVPSLLQNGNSVLQGRKKYYVIFSEWLM